MSEQLVPSTNDKWLAVSQEFGERWNFHHSVGSINGKHVVIQCPHNSTATYHNYKGTFSIVLIAMVDGNYNFMYAHVGTPGKASDGGVFVDMSLYGPLERGELLPEPIPLSESDFSIPFVIIVDDAFALTKYIIKTYSTDKPKKSPKRIFNYRLLQARHILENAFGVMASVFRVFRGLLC